MKIFEFFNTEQESEKPRFDFDVPDDVHQYMVNDPMFYRRTYYPAVNSMCKRHAKGKKVDPAKELRPIILNACANYVEQFKINADPNTLLDQDEISDIATKIFNTETKNK